MHWVKHRELLLHSHPIFRSDPDGPMYSLHLFLYFRGQVSQHTPSISVQSTSLSPYQALDRSWTHNPTLFSYRSSWQLNSRLLSFSPAFQIHQHLATRMKFLKHSINYASFSKTFTSFQVSWHNSHQLGIQNPPCSDYSSLLMIPSLTRALNKSVLLNVLI